MRGVRFAACCSVAALASIGGSAASQSVEVHLRTPVNTARNPSAVESSGQTAGQSELVLDLLVDDVLSRHPTLAAAEAAWRAAAARYPQVVSLDDPMLDTIMAPGSIGARDVDFAYALQTRQKIPWPGKRPLRGQMAQHETGAAFQEVADARLQLVQATKSAFYEYFVARQLLELNVKSRDAVEQFRASAIARYETNLVSQQDVLLGDVELADLEREQFEFARRHRVAVARINTLLLRGPTAPLPPPPTKVRGTEALSDVETLRQLAVEQRPDLGAALSRLRLEQAGMALANREFKPDLELVGRYDTFWLPQDRLVGQVGVTLNVPLAQERRRAAVREASAKVSQRRAEVDRLVAQVQFEVQEAYERVAESRSVVVLYRERILPAAEKSVQSALASYQTGKVDFLRLVEAQRQLIRLRQRQVETLADYHSRVADLERAFGGPLPNGNTPELLPMPGR